MPAPEHSDLFLSLTPDRVLAAVEAAGLETNPVCYPLNSFENRVYEVELVDRSRIVAKFYRPGRWSEEQILEEHRFLRRPRGRGGPGLPGPPLPRRRDAQRADDGICYASPSAAAVAPPTSSTTPPPSGSACWSGASTRSAPGATRRTGCALTADAFVRDDLAWLDEHRTVAAAALAALDRRRRASVAERLDALARRASRPTASTATSTSATSSCATASSTSSTSTT